MWVVTDLTSARDFTPLTFMNKLLVGLNASHDSKKQCLWSMSINLNMKKQQTSVI